MNHLAAIAILVILSACSGPSEPANAAPRSDSAKTEGPDVKTLSPQLLDATLKECMRYGRMDDPRVRFTPRYCSAVMSEHLSTGYTKTAPSGADSTLPRMH